MNQDNILQSRLSTQNMQKLRALGNDALNELIADAVLKFQPNSVFVSTGSAEDAHYVRTQAIRHGEEIPLIMPGHTVHYDGYEDQGRDPGNTRFLVSGETSQGSVLNCIEREEGLHDIAQIMNGIMHGREMIVSFYSLGPLATEFAIPCVQLTDSFYVAHSEDILYRSAYELFKSPSAKEGFFGFLHSSGALEHGVSRDVDHRRIFIDLDKNFVYSANTQYAGNTVAAKKLAHRLAIRKASEGEWLAEHFYISGVPSYEGNKTTYIAGAFPSWCGKTSTSMLFQIVGDDLAHVRKRNGEVYAANVEKGMFGVIKDVNPQDDPYIHDLLVKPGEIIFSNVLDAEGNPFWQGMGEVQIPLRGCNHSGPWWRGKKDKGGKVIPVSHDNARFCVALGGMENFDPTEVVSLDGIVYGGRSSKRPVPVMQSYGWVHGVFYAAGIESEPTAATVGASSAKVIINPMANAEFLSIPVGRYLEKHIKFARGLKEAPKIFYVNYFLRNEKGEFMNTKMDKKVWIRWIERRIAEKVGAVATPIGFIPIYGDLVELFRKELGVSYSAEQYESQFMTRVPELLEKLDIVEGFYKKDGESIPRQIFEVIDLQRRLLVDAQELYGDNISPLRFKGYQVPLGLTQRH